MNPEQQSASADPFHCSVCGTELGEEQTVIYECEHCINLAEE
nr:hypothetical protein [Alicyclobacillus tolerans]